MRLILPAVLLAAAPSFAHSLMVSPAPRSDESGITDAPCGSAPHVAPVRYRPGQKVMVRWNVLQPHADPPESGRLRIAFSPGNDEGFSNPANVLLEVHEMGGPGSGEVTLPTTPCTGCSLRFGQMFTNGAGYYSCADIVIEGEPVDAGTAIVPPEPEPRPQPPPPEPQPGPKPVEAEARPRPERLEGTVGCTSSGAGLLGLLALAIRISRRDMKRSRRLTMRLSFAAVLLLITAACTPESEPLPIAMRPAGGAGGAGGGAGGGATAGGAGGGSIEGPGGGGGGATQPMQPDFPRDGFCNEATPTPWAYCEDFDGLGMNGRETYPAPSLTKLEFHAHSHMSVRGVTCETSGDCSPYLLGGSAFINSEDSGFGMSVTRLKQPFDFTGRTGHLRFTADLKGHPRMQLAVQLSPQPTNNMPDLRDPSLGAMDKSPALTIIFQGEGGWPFSILAWKNGANTFVDHGNGPLGIDFSGLHTFDIDVTRTTLVLKLDGIQRVNTTFDDLGFDKAYVHLTQVSYNPVKDGFEGDAKNRFQWDNIAFDGPALAVNALTPAGQQEVLFRAYSTDGCTVRGVPADGPHNLLWAAWHTWHVHLNDTTPVTASDIVCNLLPNSPPYAGAKVQEIESIQR